MVDANKIQITREVTNAASIWLRERGFKPVESEVSCDEKWTADLASFCYPTRTEAQKLKIIRQKPSNYKQSNWQEELHGWEIDYAVKIPHPLTTLVEVKTAFPDFNRDDKFQRESPVNLLYIAYPASLIDPTKIDIRWGILSCNKKGIVKCTRSPQLQMVCDQKRMDIIAQVAIRRDHFTTYERSREFLKQTRNHNNERITRLRISQVLDMILKIQSEELSVDEALLYCLPRTKLPQSTLDALYKLGR